jgi:hypothetical protein
MKVSGLKITSDMDKDTRFGVMEVSMKGSGSTIKPMEKADLSTLTVTFMMETGGKTKLMALVSTPTPMEPSILDTGRMISSTERVTRSGQMVPNIKALISKAKKMETVDSFGLTNLHMKVILWTIIFTDMADTNGLMTVSMKVTGRTIRCMV